MTAVGAEWYDRVLDGSRAMAPLDQSSALPVYLTAADFVTHLPIVDLGCGTGRFAELLHQIGFASYHGYDFAPAVVNEARSYCQHDGYTFQVADLREWEHGPNLPDEVCYVLLEVLEHLDDDRDILTRLAPGQPVVFSVPNFWSESHVRRFLQPADVFARYGALLDFRAWRAVEFPTPGRRIHVFAATTRASRL
jgi:trans-aconitate methyltransferase